MPIQVGIQRSGKLSFIRAMAPEKVFTNRLAKPSTAKAKLSLSWHTTQKSCLLHVKEQEALQSG